MLMREPATRPDTAQPKPGIAFRAGDSLTPSRVSTPEHRSIDLPRPGAARRRERL
jgi:hypothetical protein